MPRYIDAEELLKEINEEYGHLTMFDNQELIAVKMRLKTMPIADVVEVKHGEWVDKYGNKYANHLFICSVCGKEALCEYYTNELGQIKEKQALTPVCPLCGAKMDGERK